MLYAKDTEKFDVTFGGQKVEEATKTKRCRDESEASGNDTFGSYKELLLQGIGKKTKL